MLMVIAAGMPLIDARDGPVPTARDVWVVVSAFLSLRAAGHIVRWRRRFENLW